jgi:hypothetical protein
MAGEGQGADMTSLAQYDRVCAAIAEATQVDDLVPLLDELELAKLKAKQIKDHKLLADATEFELRAERRLGEIIEAAKEAGLFRQGRQAKKKSSKDFLERPTLADAGIDSKLSQRAQSRADMAPELFEDMISTTRERIAASGAKTLETSDVNGARAIMGSREEAFESLDYFPTPPWATRALLEKVIVPKVVPGLEKEPFISCWEPACGEGHMAEVLREYFKTVVASDIHGYGYGNAPYDFLTYDGPGADWIITNPPFGKKTEQFVLRAIELAQVGVAMFVRLQWLESVGRYENIFLNHPPTLIAFFSERVPLCKGAWKPENSTATAYIWLLWIKNAKRLPPFWIPPNQRKLLTYPDDAARFTAKPVIRKEDYKPSESRTTQEPQTALTPAISSASAPEPASTLSSALQPMGDAGSPSLPELILPGMAPTFETIAAFVDLTSAQSANGS